MPKTPSPLVEAPCLRFPFPVNCKYGAELQEHVEQAITEAQERDLDKTGKDVTPWLLDRVRQLSDASP